MDIEITINNPFFAKHGLIIALEIARYELSSKQIDRINNFISLLDNSFKKSKLTVSSDLSFDLDKCVSIFKESASIQWIREDFVTEVLYINN
ncbi:MAG: hypothetical protein ACQEUD_20070 [Bacillota bacterium]